MPTVITILIVLAMVAVVVALVRGLIAFLRTSSENVRGPDAGGTTTDMHAVQNKMMFARVKYQAIAVILLVLLGIAAAAD